MSKIIYKYKITESEDIQVEMPKGAQILHADIMSNGMHVWALVNPKHKLKKKTFRVIATGQEISDYDKKHYHYIKTMIDGIFVWHLYELIE
jgi:hypothetical protein